MQDEGIVKKPLLPVNAAAAKATVSLLSSILPEVDWLLRYAEKEDNWIRLPSIFARAITNGLGRYVELYEDERRVAASAFFGLLGEEGARSVLREMAGATP